MQAVLVTMFGGMSVAVSVCVCPTPDQTKNDKDVKFVAHTHMFSRSKVTFPNISLDQCRGKQIYMFSNLLVTNNVI